MSSWKNARAETRDEIIFRIEQWARRIRLSIILIIHARTLRGLRTRVITSITRSLETGCSRVQTEVHTYTPTRRSHTQLCTPTRTTFIHKSRATPRRALLSLRSAFYERSEYAASRLAMHIRHIRTPQVSLHGGKKLCANGRDRYRGS